jgi:hypothetical protein
MEYRFWLFELVLKNLALMRLMGSDMNMVLAA